MDLIADYSDEEAKAGKGLEKRSAAPARIDAIAPSIVISAAPAVDTSGLVLVNNEAVAERDATHFSQGNGRLVKFNLPADQMHAPALGPANIGDLGGLSAVDRTHWSGRAEGAHVSSYSFEEQYHSFKKKDNDSAAAATVPSELATTTTAAAAAAGRTKRQKTKQTSVDPSAPFVLQSRQPWATKEAAPIELTLEQRAMIEAVKEEKAEKAAAEGKSGDHTIFHGAEEKDYQNRSWVEVASGQQHADAESCFIPKRHIHTWSGHTKGVNAIRFFPKTGHLLLSAGLDGRAKVWDVSGNKKCMRTYIGHTKGVRDTWFSPDGRQFATTAYDKAIKLWDTETGAVVNKFSEGQMAYTVRCHPDDPTVLMAGMQNKKILQFDTRTGDVVQEYDYHLAAVNSVTFIDENRRFMSTSDDKSIRVWEFGIPVQVKYIADPTMHAISAATLTANGTWWLGQSADNQIVTYSANDRVKQNRKKTFKGHTAAGYACQMSTSHDSRYVISGDGDGKLFVWDWKSTKIVRSLKAHEGPCVDAEWHPVASSKVATCGWDGLIKLWD